MITPLKSLRQTFVTAGVFAALSLVSDLPAATYYVDFADGADANAGTSAEAAFKHSPGDPGAKDASANTKLQPGDTLLFKGGVVYRGIVNVTASGAEGSPITLDGNTAGAFGKGRAVIDGAEPLTGWKRCASAAEAKGNPQWADIFYTDVPTPKAWNTLNLCDADTSLPIAQQPNPADPLFQEDPDDYLVFDGPLKLDSPVNIVPGPGLRINKQRPLVQLLEKKAGGSAIIDPLVGGSFSFELAAPATVRSVGIAPLPKYPAPREVVFASDGKELLKATLEKDKKEIQRFDLPEPATFRKLTVTFLSAFEGETKSYTAIREVAAYAADGTDVLASSGGGMTLTDTKGLDQPAANDYDGMIFAVHAGPNLIYYLPVRSYDPAAHRLSLPLFSESLYPRTRYAFFNSVRLIDQPGEYSVEALDDAKRSRVFLLPPRLTDGQPADIGVANRASGIDLHGASHVNVQGFLLRRQNGTALEATGPASDVTFRDCEVTLVRAAAALSEVKTDKFTVERCYVHHNPGHTRGIVLRDSANGIVRDCRVVKNTATGVDFYSCSDAQVLGNTILGQRGMHANGLTFYLGCKNVHVEGNRVAEGRAALTFQQIENLVVCNNILDANGKGTVVGIWPIQPIRNIQILNNTIVGSDRTSDWQAALFTNAKALEGLIVRNNIIDGLFNDTAGVFKQGGTFSNNLYTRKVPQQASGPLGQNEIDETDLKKVFVDPDKGDVHLRAGSPAIGSGTDVGLEKDFANEKVPRGKSPDIGAYQYSGK